MKIGIVVIGAVTLLGILFVTVRRPAAASKAPVAEAKVTGPIQNPPPSDAPPSAPAQTFEDPRFGLSATIPLGWVLNPFPAPAPSQRQNTVWFSVSGRKGAPTIFYKLYDSPPSTPGSEVDTFLKKQADDKARQRISEGIADYKNDNMTLRHINGRRALTWTANFTRSGEPWKEYLTRLHSDRGTVLFFLMAPREEIEGMIPTFESMIQSAVFK